jgi:hypothetical protein
MLHKIRVEMPENEKDAVSVSGSTDLCLVLIDMESQRKAIGEEWYGLKFTLSHDRRCNVELNYDSTCAEDPTFFDS